ncbi:MAG: carboxypeptidase regulatory-like domain-containing protein, partial [Acidobacteriia bacterium]|nr:carboxypeptidase regulatory-like domain-containing protein [Terriglobia bacterium]
MKRIAFFYALLFGCAPVFAAISGTVVNGTTGKPEAGATVNLLRMTAQGPQPAGQVKADAQGKFSLDQAVQGPTLVRATVDGVTYNKVLAPGMPSEGLTLDVYNSSAKADDAKVSKHMILFEPTGQELVVNEAYIVSNTGKTTWNDTGNGTLHFFLPAGVQGQPELNATPPGGQPLKQAPEKTSAANVYKINFAMRPGDTRVDLTYSVPYQEGAAYTGKIVSNDENTYLIVPSGITMKGENLSDLGQEPRTQAHIYGLKDKSYEVALAGTVSARNTDANPSSQDANDGQPPIQQIMPR